MADEISSSYEREGLIRARIKGAGEAIASVRARVEEQHRKKIAGLIDVRLRLADAYIIGKGEDVSRAVAAHASALAEIAAIADAVVALHVREPQAQVAQIDLEIADVEREIAGLEKVARPQEGAIAKLRGDLQKVTQRLGNQKFADDETPGMRQAQDAMHAALRELENKYEAPIKSLRDSLKTVELLRPPLERKIATAIVAASEMESRVVEDDEQESAGGRARGPRMTFS